MTVNPEIRARVEISLERSVMKAELRLFQVVIIHIGTTKKGLAVGIARPFSYGV